MLILNNFLQTTFLLLQCKVDGLVISNTTTGRENTLQSSYSKEVGGLSGKPLMNSSTTLIKDMFSLTKGEFGYESNLWASTPSSLPLHWGLLNVFFSSGKVPIVGVGGIFTGQDAYEKIGAGASLIQLYTAYIYHGPPRVTRIKQELEELLRYWLPFVCLLCNFTEAFNYTNKKF